MSTSVLGASPLATHDGWMLDVLSVLVNRYRVTDRVITYCNQAWADHYQVARDDALGRVLDDFLSDDEIAGLHAQLERIGPDQPVVADSVERVDAGTTPRWLHWVDHYVVTEHGPEVMSVGQDVTDRHDARTALADSEARFRSLADTASDIVWRIRSPGVQFDYMSPSVRRVMGYDPDEFLRDADGVTAIAEPETREAIRRMWRGGALPDRIDLRLRHADGHLVVLETSITACGDAIQGVGRDVTEIRHLQASLARAASTDALTGIANRRAFDEALTEELDQARRDARTLAVVYVDLDGLKVVNDHHGHEAGDIVLSEAARRITDATDDGDVVARLGGDEFAVIHHLEPGASVDRLVARIDDRFVDPIRIGPGAVVRCRASVGVADTDAHGWLPNKLVAAADRAMYATKRRRAHATTG